MPGGAGGGPMFLFDTMAQDVKLMRQEETGNWMNNRKPIPGDWSTGAEISFFSTEPCGRISLPYEIKSVDLKH